jgi:hypothetical protein
MVLVGGAGDRVWAQEPAQHLQVEISPVPDCSECKARLERALEALTAAHAENARLRERIEMLEKSLEFCHRKDGYCRPRLRKARAALAECTHELGGCREGFAQCREKLAYCDDALGKCRYELDECRGAICCDPRDEPGTHDNPFCFEGATCCSDGTWACNAHDGSPTCDVIGKVCQPDPCRDPVTGEARCCLVDGVRYAIGESFPAGDGCNVCTCGPTGVPICSLRPCKLELP